MVTQLGLLGTRRAWPRALLPPLSFLVARAPCRGRKGKDEEETKDGKGKQEERRNNGRDGEGEERTEEEETKRKRKRGERRSERTGLEGKEADIQEEEGKEVFTFISSSEYM